MTPFNFTSIAGNLPTSPAMMGNTVVWKPASTAVYAASWLMRLLKEAGLPDGVINMVPGAGAQIGDPAMSHPDLGGVHFTGSTEVFHRMWQTVGGNIASYKSYPRIVGETGGKNFVFAHASADADELAANLIRGAYEYQGQKCSATSRAYLPESLWNTFRDQLCSQIEGISHGDVTDFTHFMGAVIDQTSYDLLKSYIDAAKTDPDADIVCGGTCDDTTGYFVSPTVIQAHNPHYRTMEVELFGPVLTVYVYPDREYAQTLELCSTTSPYALTGAIVGQRPEGDQPRLREAAERRRQLLHQRQTHRRGRWSAAVRWLKGLRDERQGRKLLEPDSLGECANHQGELHAAARLSLPTYARDVTARTTMIRAADVIFPSVYRRPAGLRAG